ncbi:unnamed protein product [Porites evermanni]|uniref:Uncharacterized protein n=1 Tax=Porites evermanni TaxID=104178 RepID=A0ABN8RIV1_9CNID|nr:unnamed protein product [Porites evermanni]
MPAKRKVEPSKPKARKMRSYNIGKDSTCIGQENALHGESILLKENEESREIDRDRQKKSDNLRGDGEFGVVNKGSYRGQDGRIYDVTAKRFEGEFCVHLSKERFRTSELARPTPSDIPAKGTLKFRQPMSRTCDSGKDTRTSVGQNSALKGESILLKENEESWEIDREGQRKSGNLPGDGEFGVVNKGNHRGQDGRIYDVTAKRFEGEFCVHLSKERFRTSELPRPIPSDIPAKRTLKSRQPMPRTCDSGKDTRTSVGQRYK